MSGGEWIIKLADGLLSALTTLIKGPMLLISDIFLYVSIIDIVTRDFIFIPVSIVVLILMFFITYFGVWILVAIELFY
ncbi:hypothetical protein [Spiroplasma endosymbiont of Polydrusus formosus]|uniref:hypothetical protein n=1 Tax=Spiroplasma endosymbiont of Polydrusus formosus TaxID=3139326 RepID=UPI0035B55889